MLLTLLSYLLYSNGLTFRSDSSILYSRATLTILFYCLCSAFTSFYITYLEKGVGLYGGLFNITAITQTFQIFIFLISILILSMSSFYPRKKFIDSNVSVLDSILKSTKQYVSIINKTSEQFTIIEYALIILFAVSGATLLISSADLGSIYRITKFQFIHNIFLTQKF